MFRPVRQMASPGAKPLVTIDERKVTWQQVVFIPGSFCPHPRHVLLHLAIMKPGLVLHSPSKARRSQLVVL